MNRIQIQHDKLLKNAKNLPNMNFSSKKHLHPTQNYSLRFNKLPSVGGEVAAIPRRRRK